MIKQVYSVFDSCSGVYSPPMAYINEGEAKRDFTDACNQSESKLAMHPEHFSLYWLGSFDDARGELKPGNRKCVCTAQEILSVVVDMENASG